jgi:Coenzyme PQQ synthesis protein D (PqqD)
MKFSEKIQETYFSYRPVAKNKEVVIQEMEDELLVYDLQANKAICLNKTSALVWQFCDGKNNPEEISLQLEKKLKTIVQVEVVLLALKQLDEAGLIIKDQSIPNHFGNLSRREIVKRIGLTTVVALPIVSAIVAPSAASAQSGICFNPGGAPAGTVISPFTNCVGTVQACLNVCNNQTNAPTACQSCMAAFQPDNSGGQPTECTFANPCVCACA